MFLLPEAKYELQHGDQVTFADIGCVYLREDNASKVRHTPIDRPLQNSAANLVQFHCDRI